MFLGFLDKVTRFSNSLISIAISYLYRANRFLTRVFYYIVKRSYYLSNVFKNMRPNNTVRVYLKKEYTLLDFFKEVNTRDINYTVLRWFDELPYVKPGEDIDILVAYDDYKVCMEYFTPFELSGGQKFDIYCSSFLDGSNYHNISYYPQDLAFKILSDSSINDNGVRSPNKISHKLSLLYHILFHKAERSGYSLYGTDSNIMPEHDYKSVLNSMFDLKVESLKEIFEILSRSDFLPNIDTMKKLSGIANSCALRELISEYEREHYPVTFSGSLSALVIREELKKNSNIYNKLFTCIEYEGLEILDIKENIDEEFSKNVRGNNWNKGPWPVSGGKPKEVVFVYNHSKESALTGDHFEIDKKIKSIKNYIRDYTSQVLSYNKTFNGLHTSDGSSESLEYAELICEEYKDSIIRKCLHFDEFENPLKGFKVIEEVTRFGRRANVYKVYYDNDVAIVKIYKNSHCTAFNRELELYKNVKSKHLPKLLDYGCNYMVLEYINPDQDEVLNETEQVDRFVMDMFASGYFNADTNDSNIIRSKGCVYFIDFEFTNKYLNKALVDIPYEYAGIPIDEISHYHVPSNYASSQLLRYPGAK